jgi:hypothetical protein
MKDSLAYLPKEDAVKFVKHKIALVKNYQDANSIFKIIFANVPANEFTEARKQLADILGKFITSEQQFTKMAGNLHINDREDFTKSHQISMKTTIRKD